MRQGQAFTLARALGAVSFIEERYPDGCGIFAYQFMTSDGRNLATFVTSTQAFLTHDGGGRAYQFDHDTPTFLTSAKGVLRFG